MVIIKKVEKGDVKYITSIAELHRKAFQNFFLTQLGLPFLKTLYKGYINDDKSGIVVAEIKGELVGFMAYSTDYSGFYRRILHKYFVQFVFYAFLAVVFHPLFCKRLFRALRKSEDVRKEEVYVELASICVNPNMEKQGIGSMLIQYLKANTDFSVYKYINLETDACGNDAINQFYLKNGFQIARQYITNEGRKMNEYRFYGKNNRGNFEPSGGRRSELVHSI